MDDSGEAADAAGTGNDALLRENHALKKLVLALNRRLLAERKQSAIARDSARLLRKVNGELVKSALQASDRQRLADESCRRQTEFLTMLAHELRNPMASIAVANTVIASLKLDHPRLDRMTAIVRRQSEQLTGLIDDLLDAAHIAGGRLALQCRPLDLHDVIDSALAATGATLAGREQGVVLDMPLQRLPLDGDPLRLAQLFSNLLLNASKFSAPRQTITLTASVQQATVAVAVCDQGQGVALEDQGAIFDLFAQGSQDGLQAWSGGLGIGLTLARAIATLHGGSLRVDSAGAGCGSNFVVLLPLRAASAQAGAAPA